MLTLLADYSHLFGPLNVFRYITFRAACAAATALFFVFFYGPGVISALRLKQGKGQPIREDGPASHLLNKKGTPTMGGLMILSGLIPSTLLWANFKNAYVWIVLFVTICFGAIGFYDDYLKVTKQSHKGFSGRLRLLIEFIVAGVACYAMTLVGGEDMHKLGLPMLKGFVMNLGWFFLPFGAFVIVAAGNCVNLTDGLDGLAIVPSMIGAVAVSVKQEFVLVIVGGLFVLEGASVIVQVGYFKLTGKRIFLMAPIHHHFEEKGWKEPQIVIRFWIIAFVLALMGLSTLKLR